MNEQLQGFMALKLLVEEEQGVKTLINQSDNNITIKPLNDITIGDNFLQVTFRIDGEMLVLSWLYLLYESNGTGSKVVSWFREYCKANDLKVFKIANVAHDKLKMHSLSRKFGFAERQVSEDNSDYYLKIYNDEG